MVGLTDLFSEIRDVLIGNPRLTKVVFITGTAGIGKTALAKKILQDTLSLCRWPLNISSTKLCRLFYDKILMEGDDDLVKHFSKILIPHRV